MPLGGTDPPARPSRWRPSRSAPGSRSRCGPSCRADRRRTGVEVHCTGGRGDTLGAMWGAVIVVIAMVLVLPIILFVAGALWSALVGRALTAERPSEGTG